MPLKRRPLLRALATLMLLLAIGLFSAFRIEPARLLLVEHSVPLRECPPPLEGLRIAVIADLHAGAPYVHEKKIGAVVEKTNAAEPDLILLAGDLFTADVLTARPMDPAAVATLLSGLHAPLGVYAVLGNHDYDHAESYRGLLAANGIRTLDNQAIELQRDGKTFWLAGFADLMYGKPDIAGTLATVPEGAPLLAFTHEPDLFPQVPARVNLLIAGHTHGGQVWLPLIGRPIVPSIYGQRYAAGHVREQTDLFVSTGIGTTHIPARFLVPPEVSLLTLQADTP